METGGANPAGSGRALRLDPFALPVRFRDIDARADGRERQIELDPERVVVRRAIRGIPMAVGVAVSDFRGVVLRLSAPGDDGPIPAASLQLEHRDAALSVPLLIAPDNHEIMALWNAWGRILGLPLLVVGPDGALRHACPQIGALRVAQPSPRRRRHNAVRNRRPAILLRRRAGRTLDAASIHRGEREIVARH